ncbi:MAG TPA: hypothetical protein VM843_06705 [Flavisolibacter sp.]|jgi:hypothetical protein|nr:hypothetical protein [Flavisolibacter sp.]
MSQELQNKLSHFTATPPERCWNALAEALEHQNPAYVQRISEYEETPAKQNWEAIANSLTTMDQPARVISPTGFRLRAKMMIAVAVLTVLAFGIIRIIGSGFPGDDSKSGTAKHLPSGVGSKRLQDGTSNGTDNSEKAPLLNETYSQKATSETTLPSREVKLKPSRYVTINNDEGKQVRLSKKAYTLMACAQNSTAANYNNCKESIQMMQQKMSASLISPSGDFSGLVDMVRSVEEIN